jgi:hypothetical protein
VSGGTIYIRDLTVTGGSPGITADSGNILRLDHVSVSNNTAGGILLNGAGFEITDTTVNNNAAATSPICCLRRDAHPKLPWPRQNPKSHAIHHRRQPTRRCHV